MRAVGNFLRESSLKALATPEDYESGAALAATGEVDILVKQRNNILAIAGGGASQRSRVSLRIDEDGLRWSCTCTTDADRFCEHAVATAIAARKVRSV